MRRASGHRARRCLASCVVLLAGLSGAGRARAQDLDPGTYTNTPVGANVLVLALGRTSGEIIFDPTLPVEDATAAINAGTVIYARALGLAGRAARVEVMVPYTWGSAEGLFLGEQTRITRSGLADPRVRVAVNLIGAPSLTPREFATYRQTTILGISLQVVAPLGQYDPTKLINLGSNRWAFKPEIGLSRAWGRWRADLHASVWLTTDNTGFLVSSTRSQEPLAALQTHFVRTFAGGVWVSFGGTFFRGGQTQVDGLRRNDLQSNSRLGTSLTVPFGPHAVKAIVTSGLTTRIGGDFDTYAVAYQFTWLD